MKKLTKKILILPSVIILLGLVGLYVKTIPQKSETEFIIDDEMVFEPIDESPSALIEAKEYCFNNREFLETLTASTDGCIDELKYKEVKKQMVDIIKSRKKIPPSFQEVMLWQEMVIKDVVGKKWDLRECQGMNTIDILNTLLEQGECKQ